MLDRQKLMSELKLRIINDKEYREERQNGIDYNVYYNIDKYLELLDNIYDKIHLAQWCNNREKVNKLIEDLPDNLYDKEKYMELVKNNQDLLDTINFQILSPKYGFLNDILDMLVTDIDIQELLLSLSDSKLEIFKLMYQKLREITTYHIPYVYLILRRLGVMTPDDFYSNNIDRYNDLEEDIKDKDITLTDEDILKLLFIYTSNTYWGLSSLEELRNIDNPNSIVYDKIDDSFNEASKNGDIDKIKETLLLRTYGIDYQRALELCEKYNLKGLSITHSNSDLFEMYNAIVRIVYESDRDILIEIYKEFTKSLNPKLDFMRITVFEEELRKEFAKELHSQVFKIGNQSYTELDGIKIYDAGTNFKMIITAIGAFNDDFTKMDNYCKYWNQPSIRSHGNCCSLIGSNNLSIAPVKNIILGFESLDDDMLLLMGDKDLGSTPYSIKFDMTRNVEGTKFMTSSELINNTRGDYNELVYERRDLSNNPESYKKNPDYIVFINDYEDIDTYIEEYRDMGNMEMVLFLREKKQEEEYKWNETIKAAHNFNIPIVKINRESCAKSELQRIYDMLVEFERTNNPELISKIIVEYQNNRYGNSDSRYSYRLIQKKYFSKKNMDDILMRINNTIMKIDDSDKRMEAASTYRQTILLEKEKLVYYQYMMDIDEENSFYFFKTLRMIDMLSNNDNRINKLNSSFGRGK